MTDNTPLNADDELGKYLFETWNMKDTVHNRVLVDGINRWRKKHELQARIDEIKGMGHIVDWAYYDQRALERINELKQELENL